MKDASYFGFISSGGGWQGIVCIHGDRGYVVAERVREETLYYLSSAQRARRAFSLHDISRVKWLAKADTLENLNKEMFTFLL